MPEDKMNASLETRIILALETAPRPEIPPGFAARVAAQLSPRPTVALTSRHYGQRAAVACLVLLLPLIFAFAHRATGSNLYWLSIESIFCAQFAVLAVWLVASASSL